MSLPLFLSLFVCLLSTIDVKPHLSKAVHATAFAISEVQRIWLRFLPVFNKREDWALMVAMTGFLCAFFAASKTDYLGTKDFTSGWIWGNATFGVLVLLYGSWFFQKSVRMAWFVRHEYGVKGKIFFACLLLYFGAVVNGSKERSPWSIVVFGMLSLAVLGFAVIIRPSTDFGIINFLLGCAITQVVAIYSFDSKWTKLLLLFTFLITVLQHVLNPFTLPQSQLESGSESESEITIVVTPASGRNTVLDYGATGPSTTGGNSTPPPPISIGGLKLATGYEIPPAMANVRARPALIATGGDDQITSDETE